MARLLVLAFDTYGATEELDRFAWKLGHIVDVKPDDHVWGAKEGLPKFWHIELPGLDPALVSKFLDEKIDFSDLDNPLFVGIRKWILNVNQLPVPARNALINNGSYTIKNQILETIESFMALVV